MRALINSNSPILRSAWSFQGTPFSIAYEKWGSGPLILLLPALSTISTREEMRPLAERLAPHYTCVLLDWPGFGESSRPRAAYSPELYTQFLQDFPRSVFLEKITVIAAGHGAGYVLRVGALERNTWLKMVVVAPTWRGPLPTAMGPHPRLYSILRAAINCPGIGHVLYYLNTTRTFLRRMAGRHVFSKPEFLTDEFVEKKIRTARRRGARYASAAFVTGKLDPFSTRDAFLQAVAVARPRLLIAIGRSTPQKSRSEMDAVAGVGGINAVCLEGSLGLHEENPDDVAAWIITDLNLSHVSAPR